MSDFAILRGFNFHETWQYAKFHENKALAKISEFTGISVFQG